MVLRMPLWSYDDWKCTPPEPEEETCPDCGRPFLRGLCDCEPEGAGVVAPAPARSSARAVVTEADEAEDVNF